MQIKKFDSVCIWSENPDKLAEFYEKVIGLKPDNKIDFPDDYGITFVIDGVFLFIGRHDKVTGKAKDPYRIMPGFVVDSVDEVYKDLSSKGVEFIRMPSWSPDNMYRAATILDPEGNIIQFFSDYKN